VDVDSMLRRVYGKQKQGVGFGHAKVGGYHVSPAGIAGDTAARLTGVGRSGQRMTPPSGARQSGGKLSTMKSQTRCDSV
jgi:hypothetical protein